MENSHKTITLRIAGMTCEHCRTRVQQALSAITGVCAVTVDLEAAQAIVQYDAAMTTPAALEGAVSQTGYTVLPSVEGRWLGTVRAGGLVLAIAALYFLLERFKVLNYLTPGALATADMGYGMLFVIGLTTSVHCVAMCGGINLSQCIGNQALAQNSGKGKTLLPSILYNGGRVISYTIIGFAVGALGATVSFSPAFQGALKLIAGILMLAMGLRLLGLFPRLGRILPHMPKWISKPVNASRQKLRSPLLVGMLNGLMPCGPLQAMQIYALSTGSALQGALSMFLFSLGTVPLMLAFGALSTALGRRFSRRMVTVGALLVAVLGLSMFTQGVTLTGLPALRAVKPGDTAVQSAQAAEAVNAPVAQSTAAAAQGTVQEVNSILQSNAYPSITVQAGIPVAWTINAPAGSINGCNNRMLIPQYGIDYTFKPGDNLITFTPDTTGTYPYSCWMGMIRASITVVEAGEAAKAVTTPDPAFQNVPQNTTKPSPSGIAIDTENIAFAKIDKDVNGEPAQRIQLTLDQNGFSPAVLVVQAGIGVAWRLTDNLAQASLLVPDYQTVLPLTAGENTFYFMPDASFVFSDESGTTYGYVKVVDNLATANETDIRAEVAQVETLRYPAGYFDSQAAGVGSCCE